MSIKMSWTREFKSQTLDAADRFLYAYISTIIATLTWGEIVCEWVCICGRAKYVRWPREKFSLKPATFLRQTLFLFNSIHTNAFRKILRGFRLYLWPAWCWRANNFSSYFCIKLQKMLWSSQCSFASHFAIKRSWKLNHQCDVRIDFCFRVKPANNNTAADNWQSRLFMHRGHAENSNVRANQTVKLLSFFEDENFFYVFIIFVHLKLSPTQESWFCWWSKSS